MLKTFTAFYSLLPLRTVFDARFYKKKKKRKEKGRRPLSNYKLSETSHFWATENKLLWVKSFSSSWNSLAGLLQACYFSKFIMMTCIHLLLSLLPLSLSFFLSAPLKRAVVFLLRLVGAFCSVCLRSLVRALEHPPPQKKTLPHSFCHSLLPPVFSLYAHRLHSPFNPIFTDLEIAFHQLWMLKETNLLPNPGPSAAGQRKAVRLQEWLIEGL